MRLNRYVLIGVVVVAATVAFTVYVVGGLSGRVNNRFPVTATFDHVGQLLRVTGDVKMRGVLIGQVARIDHLPDGKANVTLALDPGLKIASNVDAIVRGKTLFGEKYVELIDPAHPSGEFLKPGARIPENRTIPPFELEQVLQNLVPVLDATKPGDLGGTLRALAQGLAGNEAAAQRTIDNSLVVLGTLGADRSDIDRLLAGLPKGTKALADASPDLVAALNDLDTVSKQLVSQQSDLKAVLHDTPTWLTIAAGLVRERYQDLVDLSVKGAGILDVVAAHRSALPMTVEGLKDFTQDWVTNLSTPCENAAGNRLGTTGFHPTLAGSTCWQIWQLSGEKEKPNGGYSQMDQPKPGPTAVAAAYRVQLAQLLDLPFGSQPSPLQLLVYAPIRDGNGLIPRGML